jgi:hypothetical protein
MAAGGFAFGSVIAHGEHVPGAQRALVGLDRRGVHVSLLLSQ